MVSEGKKLSVRPLRAAPILVIVSAVVEVTKFGTQLISYQTGVRYFIEAPNGGPSGVCASR
jgi:hypothetical protein